IEPPWFAFLLSQPKSAVYVLRSVHAPAWPIPGLTPPSRPNATLLRLASCCAPRAASLSQPDRRFRIAAHRFSGALRNIGYDSYRWWLIWMFEELENRNCRNEQPERRSDDVIGNSQPDSPEVADRLGPIDLE